MASPDQALGVSVAWSFGDLAEIGRVVHVKGDARQGKHNAGLFGGARGCQVRFVAVIAKAQREQSRRPAEDGIGAATVSGRDQNRAFDRCGFQYLIEFVSCDQGDIPGNHQCAFDSARLADLGGEFDGGGLVDVVVGDGVEVEFTGQMCGVEIGSDDSYLCFVAVGDRGEDIQQHGPRQFCAGGLVEHRSQALLGGGEILDGDEDHWPILIIYENKAKMNRG